MNHCLRDSWRHHSTANFVYRLYTSHAPATNTWDVSTNQQPMFYSSSSFPLAFPVIWGRRYGCWSSLSSKPCLLHRPLSVLQSACPSCTHPSTLSLVSLSSFSPVSLSSSLSSLRDLLPSSWRAHTISVFSPLSFWTPALLSSFLGCVRSWFCLFLSLRTSTSPMFYSCSTKCSTCSVYIFLPLTTCTIFIGCTITTIAYLFIYKSIMFNATIIVVRQPLGYMELAFHLQYMSTFHLIFVLLITL